MQQNLSYTQSPIFWMDPRLNPPLPSQVNILPPPPFPDFRRKRRKDGTCTYLLIIFLLVSLALFGVGIGTYKIMELQKEMDHFRQTSSDPSVSPSWAKLIGLAPSQQKESRLAAHLTAKQGTSLPLTWEETIGRAFTSGVRYKNRGLVVNQTGLYFLYSSVYFRGASCRSTAFLSHTVYKKSKRYPGELKLMENRENQYCDANSNWGRHSYLGALFNLTSDDTLYVNVSDINLISFEESKTFFGLYKL
ncbi:hypothetical protein GDO86_007681 [Hymenochirus boettgeri]|uniref:Tumor necrosis factor ligand superfamily member 6 n=1 Tax=Hymenochirus boettgeri TaxID=247094 RepID=A0A8T2IXJ8_9PIPI|nr:hypothetical protein GDO86_007681 [Hymenochirus boettgeri]